jgi:hypothetical protein
VPRAATAAAISEAPQDRRAEAQALAAMSCAFGRGHQHAGRPMARPEVLARAAWDAWAWCCAPPVFATVASA